MSLTHKLGELVRAIDGHASEVQASTEAVERATDAIKESNVVLERIAIALEDLTEEPIPASATWRIGKREPE